MKEKNVKKIIKANNGISDTIVAIGTRAGEAAIGIVKLSGNDSIRIAEKFFRSINKKKLCSVKTYTMTYGNIVDRNGSIVDEVIVSVMRKPKSYTREDVVEINCHGGLTATRRVIELCIENGARIAEPGEFTKRAFLNGRIDLSQAEAVIDIVRSRTEESLKIATKNLKGSVGNEIRQLRKRILNIMVQLEASVDFIEEDLEITPYEELEKEIKSLSRALGEMIENERKGEIVKNGVKVAIVGKPNVGKSSLLNLLSRKDRAIVTSIPGTTRDAVEEILYVEGIPLILVDTAGIRKARNTIEKIGIDRSLKHIGEAELVIAVLDGSRALEKYDIDITEKIRGKSSVCCINKADLEQKIDIKKVKEIYGGKDIIKISALKGTGIDKLEKIIKRLVISDSIINLDELIIVNERQKNILNRALSFLRKAGRAMKARMSEEFPSYDLKSAYSLLGEITGETVRDDILESIFSQFCVGK